MKKTNEYVLHIIEDEFQARKVLTEFITQLGFSSIESDSGSSGLEFLNTTIRIPDLLLVDIGLPDISGFDFIKRVKEKERLKGIPILITTALDDIQVIRDSISIGANAYIKKPINLSRLEGKIRQFLSIAS